jgi:hypothetical protein
LKGGIVLVIIIIVVVVVIIIITLVRALSERVDLFLRAHLHYGRL